jgi:hypothetical protein
MVVTTSRLSMGPAETSVAYRAARDNADPVFILFGIVVYENDLEGFSEGQTMRQASMSMSRSRLMAGDDKLTLGDLCCRRVACAIVGDELQREDRSDLNKVRQSQTALTTARSLTAKERLSKSATSRE